jgi:drug/metabolite transporter (DMT)-like permease
VSRGLWLGLLGVTVFALTLPMTRLATGSADAPQLSAWFITFGRLSIAGLLSVAFLALTRSPWPTAAQRRPLAVAVLGNALGFPLLLALALRDVPSGHAAVMTAQLGAERVICWMCASTLPLALPLTAWTWPTQPIAWASWGALLYVGVFSMWAGFFAWFRGLALGGALRVSQVQLLQPFISLMAAVPLLGEPLEAMTLGFALAVVTTVFVGKRLSMPPAVAASRASPLKSS